MNRHLFTSASQEGELGLWLMNLGFSCLQDRNNFVGPKMGKKWRLLHLKWERGSFPTWQGLDVAVLESGRRLI